MTQPAYTSETPPVDRNQRIALVKAARGSQDAKKAPGRAGAKRTPATVVPSAQQAVQVLHHPELPGVTVQFEKVTPAAAAYYLGKVPDWQRNESDKTVDEYVEDMEDDDWLFSGDTLKFTDTDDMFDGQHRLTAIERSGKPQIVLVVRGLDKAVMRVLDTGYQRRFTNYLSTQKVPYINSVGNVTGRVLDWRRGNYAHPSVARMPSARYLNAKKSHQKLIHTFEGMRDEIITAVKRGQQIRAEFPRSAPDTVFAFAFLYLNRLDPFLCAQFFDELTGKIARRSDDATYPIRSLEKTLTARAGEKGIPSYAYLNWIFRAFSHWLLDEPLSKDQYRNIKRPKWDTLAIPVDPHEAERPEGWTVL